MSFFIEIKNGEICGHPFLYDNLKLVYHNIDEMIEQGLYKKFTPTDSSEISIDVHQKLNYFYQVKDDEVIQRWFAEDLTEEELNLKKEQVAYEHKNYILYEIKDAEDIISNLADETGINLWNKYIKNLQELDVYTLEPVLFPYKPVKNEEGKWISIDSPGSAPNVIE